MELLIKDDCGVEVLLDASLDNGRPIIRDELELCVVVLDPFLLGRCLFLERAPLPLE